MSTQNYNLLKNEFNFFRNGLLANILNFQFSNNSEDCYLIEGSYINEIENCLKNYNQQYNNINQINPLNISEPKIINDFHTAINYIYKNKRIALISKKLLELLGFEYLLTYYNNVSYYGGYGKLIIEYKNNNDKKSLLLLDPKNQSKQNIFIIMKDKSNISYNQLLSQIYNINDLMNYKFIISLDKYINKNYNYQNKDNYISDNNPIINSNPSNLSQNQNNINISTDQSNYNQKNVNTENNQLKSLFTIPETDNVNELQSVPMNDTFNNFNLNLQEKKINNLHYSYNEHYKKPFEFKNKTVIINDNILNYKKQIENNIVNKLQKEKEILKQRAEVISKKEIDIRNNIKKLKERDFLINQKEPELNLKKEIGFNYENYQTTVESNQDYTKMDEDENSKTKKMLYQMQKINNQKENNMILQNKKDIQNTNIDQNKNDNNKQKLFIEPIKLYEHPTLIGLNNIGSTCSRNSVLQCLSQTRALTNYFLNEVNKDKIFNNNIALKNTNSLQLSPVYYDLIQKLWSKNGEKSFSPKHFMTILEEMSKNDVFKFKTGEAGDAKDFIIFILEQFHKELKRPIQFGINNEVNMPLNQYNKDNVFFHFFNDFKENCSIISDVFFGIFETNTICKNCRNNYNLRGQANPICYNYGIFNCLIFPLEEVRILKNNYLKNNNIQINDESRITLNDCFLYNQKDEYFTGDNQNFCNICKQLSDAIYKSKIYVSPNILILILNRGKDNIYNVKIDFDETLDITNFVLKKDFLNITYNLYGVISHIGQSGPNAHFIASCKSPVDNKWYRYNDAIVSPINDVQKEVIEFGTPYILFYRKINNNTNK